MSTPTLPIRTDRLLLRLMQPADAPAIAGYRSDPLVARFQAWPMPYTLADAQRMLDAQSHLTDLDAGGWTQVAIEHEGAVVGDLGVRLDPDGCTAEIGYTLAPAAQHRGFAVEAVGAMVDALFATTDVRRVEASVEDANAAAMRVIESLGFRYEGIARGAAHVRGAWLDDRRFALLKDDRVAWLGRSTAPPQRVELVELVHENARPYAALETHRYQEEFVAPMAVSFRHALLPEMVNDARVTPWFRGIAADGVPVGFVMLALASDAHPAPYLWRLLIDRWHQRRGIGRRAIEILVELLREQGHQRLDTSWGVGPGSPERFYLGLGFVPTGNLIDDEIEATLTL